MSRRVAPKPRRLRVEPLESRALLANFLVTNATDAGPGSLRAAILAADADALTAPRGTITFAIPGAGVPIIAPASTLPTVVGKVTIDATTQPGGPGIAPKVIIDGSQAPVGASGLILTGDGGVVRGLSIGGFRKRPIDAAGGQGIVLAAASHAVVEGNYLGLNPDGFSARPNGIGIEVSPLPNSLPGDNTIGGTTPGAGNVITNEPFGIFGYENGGLIAGNLIGLNIDGKSTSPTVQNRAGIDMGGSNLTIGGTTPSARNVIAGSYVAKKTGTTGSGIALYGSNNLIEGNYIGVGTDGRAVSGIDNYVGLSLSVTNSTIGGTAQGAGNVVSGSVAQGISISDGANLVLGNLVGTDASGTIPVPNGGGIGAFGLQTLPVAAGALNTIGGTAAGAANVIAFNGTSDDIAANLRGNTFFGNVRGPQIVGTGNPFTSDAQNARVVITSDNPAAGTQTVTGLFSGTPGRAYQVDFFANNSAGTAAVPEQGQVYLGALTVTPDAGGFANFTAKLPAPATAGPSLSATATGPDGITSPFLIGLTTGSGAPSSNLLVLASAAAAAVYPGNFATYTFTVSNQGTSPAINPTFTAALPAGLADAVAFTGAASGSSHKAGDFEGNASVAAGGTVTAILDTIAPGQSATVTVVARPAATGTFALTGGVGGPSTGPVPTNNAATVTVAAVPPGAATGQAALSLTQAVQDNPAYVAGPANIVLKVANTGPDAATNVVVREVVSGNRSLAGFANTIGGIYPSQGAVTSVIGDGNSGFLIVANLGTIAPGGVATLDVGATAFATVPIVGQARVSADQSNSTPGLASNSTTVNVLPTPFDPNQLTITESDSTASPVVGGNLTYTFLVADNGKVPASSLNFGAVLPQGATLASATSSQGAAARFNPASRMVLLPIDLLVPGAPVAITLVVTPTAAGPLVGTAHLFGNSTATAPFQTITSTLTVSPPPVSPPPVSPPPVSPPPVSPPPPVSLPPVSPVPISPPPILPPPPVHERAPANYNGMGVSDLAVYLPAIGAFAIRPFQPAGIGQVPQQGVPDKIVPFGLPGAGRTIPVQGDFTGVGHAEIAAYLPSVGAFAIRPGGGGPDRIIPFGVPGPGRSIPAPANYEGTGRDNIAVYLPAIGAFAIRPGGGGPDQVIPFGVAGSGRAIPVPGDYFGTGQADIAVYLPAEAAFAIRPPGGGPDRIIPFGVPGAGRTIPAPGDYDGSGKTELAAYFPDLGLFAYRPADGGPDVITRFGTAGDGTFPVPGDYTGVGHAEIAVYDPTFGTFAYRSPTGSDTIVPFGPAGVGRSLPATAPAAEDFASIPGTLAASTSPPPSSPPPVVPATRAAAGPAVAVRQFHKVAPRQAPKSDPSKPR